MWRRVAVAGALTLAATPLAAQDFEWRGRVDDEIQIEIRGRDVKVRTNSGKDLGQGEWRFNRSPDGGSNVAVRTTSGRGQAYVSERPGPANGYVTIIRVRDSGPGDDFYQIGVQWRAGGPDPDGGAVAGKFAGVRGGQRTMQWRGTVDDEIQVEVRGREVKVRTMTGKDNGAGEWRFDRDLPRRDGGVGVQVVRGRGTVRLLEQPSGANGYAAVFRVRDSGPGADRYEIEVSAGGGGGGGWNDASGGGWNNSGGGWNNTGGGGNAEGGGFRKFVWRGTVDGRVRIEVRGREVRSSTLSGNSLSGESYNFSSGITDDARFELANVTGRGNVRLAGDTPGVAVIIIDDPQPGSAYYSFVLRW